MVMKFHGDVRGEVRVNVLALFASKPHIFMCGALKLSGIVRATVRLNIAIPILVLVPKAAYNCRPCHQGSGNSSQQGDH